MKTLQNSSIPTGLEFEQALGAIPHIMLKAFSEAGIYYTEESTVDFEAHLHVFLEQMADLQMFSKEAGWIDPAGGFHSWQEKDPCSQYE